MYTKLQERPGQTQGQQPLRKQLLLAGILFVCCVWVLFQIDLQSSSKLLAVHPPSFKENFTKGFLVNTKGCRIQDLDPFDQSIRKFIYDEKPLVCNKDNIDMLVKASGNTLYVELTVLAKYNLTEDTVNCCYRPFWRREFSSKQIQHNPKLADTTVRFANYCVPFMRTTIEEQFVTVTCQLQNDSYIDYFNFVRLNESEKETVNKGQDQRKISVLLVGVDSISRLNLHRQMPKTLQFLTETVKAVEMLGYNKVGDNTFPNLIPVLTGLSADDLKLSCWENSDTVFDECDFIWKHFKEHGFVTGFGEDAAKIGLFNYLKVGFRKQPTDFYLQAFNLVAEDEIGHEKWLNAPLCLGKRLNAEVLLDTTMQFATNLKSRPSFGFFWETSLTHDYLNLPKYGDDYYLKFFKKLYENGIFDNSFIVFFSDHGIRWGEIRRTYQGYLEERLPFLVISYPKWFAENFPHAVNNLRTNRRKLTSPYDLHETLQDLINLKNITNIMLRKRLNLIQYTKGKSLFLPINDSRTCIDASIPDVWCTCHQSVTASVSDKRVKQSANSVLTYLNKVLEGYVQCKKLYLNKIISARLEKVPLFKQEALFFDKSSLTDYTVMIETVPGKAIFEATVRYSKSTRYFTVVPPISRINTYGNQSYCISHYLLRLYCYCNSYWGS